MSSSQSTFSPQPSRASSPHEGVEPATLHLEPNDSPTFPTTTPAGPLTLSDALADVLSSPSWIGNSGGLTHSASWVEDSRVGSTFLRPKSDAHLPVDASGNVVVCWLGQVAANGSTVGADAGFKAYFRDAARHKRTVRTIKPPTSLSARLASLWEDQLKGAKIVAANSRRMENGSEPGIGYCFFEGDTGSLKARSPLFQKDGSLWESDTPEGFQYSTWDIPGDVRAIFDDVRSNHHTPRVLEAYDAFDNLIHPNEVAARLTGSIVYVTCTLEKILFKGSKVPNGRQWQVYANIIKVRLVAPDPTRTSLVGSSSKRKASEMEDSDTPDKRAKRHSPSV